MAIAPHQHHKFWQKSPVAESCMLLYAHRDFNASWMLINFGDFAEVMDTIKECQFEKEGLHSNSSALTAALGSSPAVGGSS